MEEALRRSFTSFAEVNRGLERIQFSTGATAQQMRALGGTFDEIARKTGQSVQEIERQFVTFANSTNQSTGEVKVAADHFAERRALAIL